MSNFDDLKLAVEAISGGRNTVILDDLGMPSIMVPFPKLKYSDIMAGGSQDVLPAFIVDGVEVDVIHESKYQNIVVNNRAYSLPFKDPKVYIDFDTALTVSRNKGAGWHLHSNALWAAIQSWCYKNNTVPHGNGNYGQDYSAPHEKGVPSYINPSDSKIWRTATGSGPVTWYHNYDSSGIADLCGNVWEWVAGFRLVNGEIQIIPNGNSMKLNCNMGVNSTEWKAIMPDGSLVDPGTAGTLKFDGETSTGGIRLNTAIEFTTATMANTYATKAFGTIAAKAGVNIPQLLYGLGIMPIPGVTYGNGMTYMRNHEAERLPFRGASFNYTSHTGVAALYLNNPRTNSGSDIGFRSAFCEKLKTAN